VKTLETVQPITRTTGILPTSKNGLNKALNNTKSRLKPGF